jgi:hypothetical protein
MHYIYRSDEAHEVFGGLGFPRAAFAGDQHARVGVELAHETVRVRSDAKDVRAQTHLVLSRV